MFVILFTEITFREFHSSEFTVHLSCKFDGPLPKIIKNKNDNQRMHFFFKLTFINIPNSKSSIHRPRGLQFKINHSIRNIIHHCDKRMQTVLNGLFSKYN